MGPDGQPRGAELTLFDANALRRTAWRLVPAGRHIRGFAATTWRLHLDRTNVGMAEGWPERGLPDDAVPAEVPGVWNTMFPGYAGVAWYEARFARPATRGGTVRLVVDAANYLTDAWLNGTYLGQHEGGYDAFSFRCTHALRDGENRLTLRIVDPPPDGEIDGLRLRECPTAKESWYGGAGGPWGTIRLEESSSIWIEDVRVHGDLLGERATIRVTLASDLTFATQAEIVVQVRESFRILSGRLVERPTFAARATASVGPSGVTVSLTIPVPDPRPWSPASPEMYFYRVTLNALGDVSLDVASRDFGFRACEWRDGVFHLNGEPRYLKGVLLQPSFPRTLMYPPPDIEEEDVEESDVWLAKNAGLNLIRFHLRPPPPDYLTYCDRNGMLAHVEAPLAWIEPSGRLLEHGRRELAAMVRACGNHPSVVMWGIFNENAKATEAVGGELMADLARLDPTRPIIENSGGAAVGEVGMWAWGGQTRCWSPGWEAPRPLNDVHVYLANPLRREARELMATLGDGPTLDVTPGRPPQERIESEMSPGAVLVSEYGCGALPDFDAALAAFGEETHLADAVLLRELRDDLARGLAERGLDREIGDVASLVRQTQLLQAEGIVAQTAALRRNPNVSGLILTQLADAGWEQMAGLVGIWRHPRPALEAFGRALQPRLLHVEPDDPCGTHGLVVRIHLIEEVALQRRTYQDARMLVTLEGPGDGTERRTVHDYAVAVGKQPGGETFTLSMFLPEEPGQYRLEARISAGEWTADGGCTIMRLPDRQTVTGAGLVLLGNGLRRHLPNAVAEVPDDWAGPILAYLPSRPTVTALRQAVERARAGAHLCLVGLDQASGKRVEPLIGLPLRLRSGRGNFMGMHHYVREHPMFAGLGAPCLAGSTFAEVLPAWAAEELPGAEVVAGCFTVPDNGRGFLWRASVQTMPFGRGRLTLCQFGIGQRRGGALGRYLLETLVGWLSESPTL